MKTDAVKMTEYKLNVLIDAFLNNLFYFAFSAILKRLSLDLL